MEVMTIGYEGLDAESFWRVVTSNGIETLVDVRELPLSHKPGFSKSSLLRQSQNHSVEYVHMRALGCPRPIRHTFRRDKDWHSYASKFSAHLDAQDATLVELARYVERCRCCLLCYEESAEACHRSLIARRLATMTEHGLGVQHLRQVAEGPAA
jgi:uncharacterized protein (DUF488 family)